jgi:predicted MFS family arabinose efflux permease
MARVLAGTISNFASWRYVYWMAVGLQFFIFIILYFTLPDFPPKQKNLRYHQILWTMGKFMLTEPVLVQACLNGMLTSAVFASFWTTLTFLLGDDPYDYSRYPLPHVDEANGSLVIGLFGLIGMLGVCTAPLVGRYVDRLIPWTGVLIGMCIQATGQVIVTAAGLNNIAAVIIPVFLLDVGQQMQQVSNQMRVFAISDLARARLNACYIIFLFIGNSLARDVLIGKVKQWGQKRGHKFIRLAGIEQLGR